MGDTARDGMECNFLTLKPDMAVGQTVPKSFAQHGRPNGQRVFVGLIVTQQSGHADRYAIFVYKEQPQSLVGVLSLSDAAPLQSDPAGPVWPAGLAIFDCPSAKWWP